MHWGCRVEKLSSRRSFRRHPAGPYPRNKHLAGDADTGPDTEADADKQEGDDYVHGCALAEGRVGMCLGMVIYTCADMHADICTDVRIDMRIDMCIDMGTGMHIDREARAKACI